MFHAKQRLKMMGCPSRFKIWIFVSFTVFGVIANAIPSDATTPPLQELIRNRIESGGIPLDLNVGEESVYAAAALPDFYERRAYRPAWANEKGSLPQAASLRKAIRAAAEEGLRPDDYHLSKIDRLLLDIGQKRHFFRPIDPRLLVDLDLLLTDAFLIFGSHLVGGRINPERIDPQWFVSRREADLVQVLEEALASAEIENALKSLLPLHPAYERLRKALAFYRRIAASGGWPSVPSGPRLKNGEPGDQIATLRQRLAVEGFIEASVSADSPMFDDELEQALKKFQIQNGLEPDGVLGKYTVAALNITAEERIRQIIVNMERWRWLPQDLGGRYILVNIAAFSLDVVENQKPVLDMRIVAGKPYRRTPVFSDKVTYLVMHPYWAVPRSIAEKDILPKVKKDPFKFMFPNQFDVYLHDTPSRELFAKARRDFSSGCIRIEKPVELAEYLLRNHPDPVLDGMGWQR